MAYSLYRITIENLLILKKKKFELPYAGLDNPLNEYGILYSTYGDYSVIIECENPLLRYQADRDAYFKVHQLYTNLTRILGDDYVLQKQDVFNQSTYSPKPQEDYLSNKYQNSFNGRTYNKVITHLIVTRKVKRSALTRWNPTDFNSFNVKIHKVVDLLNSRGLQPQLLREDAIQDRIRRTLNLQFSNGCFHLNNFDAQNDGLHLEDELIKSISLVDVDEINLPTQLRPYSEINDLGFPFPIDLMTFLHNVPGATTILYNQVIQVPNQHSEQMKLQAKKRKHDSVPDPANNASSEDIQDLLNDIAKEGQLLVYAHFNIVIRAKKDQIESAINFIEAELFNSGITTSRNAYNQMELFRTCLPGNSAELNHYDQFLTTSDAALCFFFKERLMTDEKSPFQIYFSDRQGIPVAIDTSDRPMETNRINNRNMFVLGPSGSGKSFFMNHLIRQYFLHNMDVILVDTGHSYQGLCRYYNGKYITYSEDNPITMNPFRISHKEYNEEKREFIKSLIGLIWKGPDSILTQVEDTILSNVVESYYREHWKNPDAKSKDLSFNSFYEYSIKRIAHIMDSDKVSFPLNEYTFILKKFYKGGQFSKILNDEMDSTLFDENFIVFEIDSIKEHKLLFPITTIIIMDVFIQKMRHKKNRKALIIEEAWKAIASPMMANYILFVYKTVRKFWGIAAVVTQELDDIIGNPIVKDSIINNSDTICLLDQTKFRDNYDVVAKLLTLNEVEQKKVFTINNLENKDGRGRFKEVYIKRGACGEVYGIEVSLYEYLTYSTEKKEKDALQFYIDEYTSYVDALEAFVTDFKSSGKSLSQFVDTVNTRSLVA